MDFHQALATVIAELTPQPWELVTPDGVTLTVIPAGLTAHPGQAEVYVRVTASKTLAARADIATTDLPALIGALEQRAEWKHAPAWADNTLTVTPTDGGGLTLTATEDDHDGTDWHTTTATIHLPEAQRLPLASALRRAADVARGWES